MGIIMKQIIQFTLNGEPVRLETEPGRPLLWVLRGDMALTGTKYGCGEGFCGACAVLVDGQAMRACVVTVEAVAGKAVTTIEGLARDGQLHPVQQAFMEHDALQCGYCTPGMIVTAAALLSGNPKASEADIVAGLDNNFCRCGAHKRILEAVRSVARNEQT
jgi:aerobic-type carbon monoxide dehydrogenase small subunit (CoxS/CutS family)